jgi:hypothetical protein
MVPGTPLFITCTTNMCSHITYRYRLRLKCDGIGAETRFRLSAKRTSPFKLAVGGQKELWQTFEETSGYVRPERVNRWRNCMTDTW